MFKILNIRKKHCHVLVVPLSLSRDFLKSVLALYQSANSGRPVKLVDAEKATSRWHWKRPAFHLSDLQPETISKSCFQVR